MRVLLVDRFSLTHLIDCFIVASIFSKERRVRVTFQRQGAVRSHIKSRIATLLCIDSIILNVVGDAHKLRENKTIEQLVFAFQY